MSIIRSFLNYLLEKWDWFRDWREKLDLSPELLDATQTYFNSLQELKNVKLTTNDSNKN